MRIAHCSDLHLLSLVGVRILDFANKRWIGGLNLLSNRGRSYHTSAFEAMIDDFNAAFQAGDLDHIICTGDITNLAMQQEFRFARDLFDRIELGPEQITVLPGNHDAYIARGNQYFSEIFSEYHQPDPEWHAGSSGKRRDHAQAWPVVRIRGPVAIIALSTSLQTPWFTAYGRLDDGQLERLGAILDDPRLSDKLRLVAIHHPPAGRRAANRVRGLRDHGRFAEVIAAHGAELIIHGHEHRDMHNQLAGPDDTRIDVLGVPSGTYEGHHTDRTASYRIFEIADPSESETAGSQGPHRPRILGHTLRRWNSDRGHFEALEDPADDNATDTAA